VDATFYEGTRKSNRMDDYDQTVFIGNLPYVVGEEELREFFADCGEIENVRLIRDAKTFVGKGIGYVMYKTKEAMQEALKKKEGAKFKGRPLRVKRAVDPKRREKKQKRKQERLEERREKRVAKKGKKEDESESEEELPRNFEDAYSSEDSDDEKQKKQKQPKLPNVVHLPESAFGITAKKRDDKAEDTELRLENVIAFNKRKK
jgi:nucleolar protein 12